MNCSFRGFSDILAILMRSGIPSTTPRGGSPGATRNPLARSSARGSGEQQGGWSIWEDLGEAREAVKMLLSENRVTELGLKALAELIMSEERVDFWRIARVLITAVMPALE